MEKFDLKISLLFYPSIFSMDDIRYSIDIVNDSITIKKQIIDNREYRGKLTNDQCIEIKKLTSTLTQKYDRTEKIVKDEWGCTLRVDDQVYYEDSAFSFDTPPGEVKSLIDYIVSLSPIPIELYGFS